MSESSPPTSSGLAAPTPDGRLAATILADVPAKDRLLYQLNLADILLERLSQSPSGASLIYSDPTGNQTLVAPIHNELTVGRAGGVAQVLLDVPHMSNLHFRIMRDEDGCRIFDLNSRNGTYVNGRRCDERRYLVDGDCIEAGGVHFAFVEGSPRTE